MLQDTQLSCRQMVKRPNRRSSRTGSTYMMQHLQVQSDSIAARIQYGTQCSMHAEVQLSGKPSPTCYAARQASQGAD